MAEIWSGKVLTTTAKYCSITNYQSTVRYHLATILQRDYNSARFRAALPRPRQYFHVRRNDIPQHYLPPPSQGGGCTGPGFHLLLFLPAHGGVMRKVSFAVSLFAIILAGSTSLLAQQPPNLENGFKHWGSYDGGSVETGNNLDGNQRLHASLLGGYPQRGRLTLAATLYQTSKNWQDICDPPDNASSLGSCHWSLGRTGVGLQQSEAMTIQRTLNKNGSGTGQILFWAFGYTLHDR